jgi:putative membrane protein
MDYVAGALGAKYTGASKTAVWGAFIGGIVGAFFSIPGLLLGPLTGAAIGEFIARKDTWQAGKVGIGTFIGFIIGTVAKIGCALTIALTILFVWLASLF